MAVAAVDAVGQPGIVAQTERMTVGAMFIPIMESLVFPAPVQMVVIGFVMLVGTS